MKKSLYYTFHTIAICIILLCGSNICFAQYVQTPQEDTLDTDNSYTEPKHIYDSSERFFNSKNYSNQPFSFEKLSGNQLASKTIDSLKHEKDFWYATAVEKYKNRQKAKLLIVDSLIRTGKLNSRKEEQKSESFDDEPLVIGNWLRYIILGAAIIIFIGAIIYFLSANKVGFFAPRNKNIDEENENLEIGDNIFALPYQDLLNKALKENNYRLATRILYLQTLKLLSENGIIQFKPDATNIHYALQLRNTGYYNDFIKVTKHYEYVWYGKFDISKNTYDIISNDFLTMQKRIIPSHE